MDQMEKGGGGGGGGHQHQGFMPSYQHEYPRPPPPQPYPTIKRRPIAKKAKSKARPPSQMPTPMMRGDKTLMSINGSSIKQTPDGRVYVFKNNRRLFI